MPVPITGHADASVAVGDLFVIVLGGKRPAMVHARALLKQQVARVQNVIDVDEAVLCLFAEVPDVLVIDGARADKYHADLVERALPALLADQIPVLWIGGGSGIIDTLDRQLNEVVLDTPFTAADMGDALAAALWVGNGGKPRAGVSNRPTTPLHMAAAPEVGRPKSLHAPPRRKTNPYDKQQFALDGKPRRGTPSEEMRALRELKELAGFDDEVTPPVPSTVVPREKGRRPKQPLRAHDTPGIERDGRPRKGSMIDDRYRVLGPLGQGGSAWVVRVTDTELDETVALKLMRTDVDDQILRRRFRREMRVCRKLVHPNIVRTYEFGNWNGRMYYTMELLEGENLAELMLRRPAKLSISRALGLLAQACSALASAHELGIVHRDIKPQNLFVSGKHEMKVTDFGVAKGTGDMGATITHGNLVVGTPAYLAPERLEDKVDLSARTDIYSLGASMYHVFTGRLPFRAPDLATLLTSIVTRDPRPPRTVNPMIPKPLERVIRKSMHRDPQKRYADCLVLRDELLKIRDAVGGN